MNINNKITKKKNIDTIGKRLKAKIKKFYIENNKLMDCKSSRDIKNYRK